MRTKATDRATQLFYVTTAKDAANVLRVGFLDGTDRFKAATEYSGVWLTDDPTLVDRAKGKARLVVDLDIRLEGLDKFEWKERRGTYRAWLIPADFLNEHVAALEIDDGDE